jgi:hypothetical protein
MFFGTFTTRIDCGVTNGEALRNRGLFFIYPLPLYSIEKDKVSYFLLAV